MGFLKNLGKGFVRSAVNQVGRDGGKVISNEIYGDRHSTPVRVVGNNGTQPAAQQGETSETSDAEYVVHNRVPSAGGIAARVFVAFLLNFLGGVVLLLYGYSKLRNADKIKGYSVHNEPQYESDRRYKNGMRYVGTVAVKSYSTYLATPEEEEQQRHVAKIYIIAGLAIIAFGIIIIAAGGGLSQ